MRLVFDAGKEGRWQGRAPRQQTANTAYWIARIKGDNGFRRATGLCRGKTIEPSCHPGTERGVAGVGIEKEGVSCQPAIGGPWSSRSMDLARRKYNCPGDNG